MGAGVGLVEDVGVAEAVQRVHEFFRAALVVAAPQEFVLVGRSRVGTAAPLPGVGENLVDHIPAIYVEMLDHSIYPFLVGFADKGRS